MTPLDVVPPPAEGFVELEAAPARELKVTIEIGDTLLFTVVVLAVIAGILLA